jgi:glyoxylase-like metal-dependent hydrolase (beta-lactamase superfamily II)
MSHTELALRPPGSLDGAPIPIAPDIAYLRTAFVNVIFLGAPEAGDGGWILIDAGIHGYADRIARAAELRYGAGARPAAIVLTHGHFDHVGSLQRLLERWDVPVYAHRLELPYLTGRSSYPPPDPTVGGGAMARLSVLYPKKPIDLGDRVHELPSDGSVPGADEWRWLATPGHAPGHVSLFRDADRALVAGDAFVTTKQESAMHALTQKLEMHGPPAYFTPDWERSRLSVERLALLEPQLAITGHGQPMRGPSLVSDLYALARDFDERAVPEHGRYVGHPAITNDNGVVSVPPAPRDPVATVALGVGAVVAVGVLAGAIRGRNERRVPNKLR